MVLPLTLFPKLPRRFRFLGTLLSVRTSLDHADGVARAVTVLLCEVLDLNKGKGLSGLMSDSLRWIPFLAVSAYRDATFANAGLSRLSATVQKPRTFCGTTIQQCS